MRKKAPQAAAQRLGAAAPRGLGAYSVEGDLVASPYRPAPPLMTPPRSPEEGVEQAGAAEDGGLWDDWYFQSLLAKETKDIDEEEHTMTDTKTGKKWLVV
eukprot:3391858-Rhodomonas_salina.1